MCTYWSTVSLFAPAGLSSPIGSRQKAIQNGSRNRPRRRRPWRQSNGNSDSTDRRWRQLQGEVRLLRPGEVRLQGQAWPERRCRERDLLDEERAGVDDEVPAPRAADLGQERDAHLGRRSLNHRLPEHLLLPEVDREAGEDLGGRAGGHQEHLRPAWRAPGGAEVPRRRGGPV